MNAKELKRLIRMEEDPKLEFKREMYRVYDGDNNDKRRFWDEFIKDIIALANGNVGFIEQEGYLIIGVDDQRNDQGTRDLFDVEFKTNLQRQIIDKVNGACHQRIPNLIIQSIKLRGHKVLAITIRPFPFLLKTKRVLDTPEQRYDSGVVFIREGESVVQANDDQVDLIGEEKQRISRNYEILSNMQSQLLEWQGERDDKKRRYMDITLQLLQEESPNSRSILSTELAELETIEQKCDIEIGKLREYIDYLENKNRFRNEISREENQRKKGQRLYKKSVGLKQKIRYLIENKGVSDDDDIVFEIRKDIKNYLYEAIENNFRTANTCFLLAKVIFEVNNDLDEAREFCDKSIKKDRYSLESYRLGMQIYEELLIEDPYNKGFRKTYERYRERYNELSGTYDERLAS